MLLATDQSHYLRGAHGFRPPQAAELYRLQAGQEVADLDSETINSVTWACAAISARPELRPVAVFTMRKDNVIFQDADRQNVSGAEPVTRASSSACTGMAATDGTRVSTATSPATATTAPPICAAASLDIEGNDIDTAPRHFGSARLGITGDLAGGTAAARRTRVGAHGRVLPRSGQRCTATPGTICSTCACSSPGAAGWQQAWRYRRLRMTNLLNETMPSAPTSALVTTATSSVSRAACFSKSLTRSIDAGLI
jgi:hypothetical protein